MATTKETLIAARNIIANKENWTKNAMARSASTAHVFVLSDEAVCFCAVGAVNRCAQKSLTPECESALHELRKALYSTGNYTFTSVIAFNDDRRTTHADVLRLFDVAIAAQ